MNAASPSLLIVGDSIALGATEVVGARVTRRTAASYVELLRRDQAGRRIELDAVVRRTTTDALAALPALLARHRPAIVMLATGGNDADIDWRRYIASRGQRIRHNVPVAQFAANLRGFIDAARAAGAVPILSDLPAGDLAGRGRWLAEGAGRLDVPAMIAASGGEAESLRRLATYADEIERLAVEADVPVVRWAAALAGVPLADRYGPDALHPGDAAHPVIARTIADALSRLDEHAAVIRPAGIEAATRA